MLHLNPAKEMAKKIMMFTYLGFENLVAPICKIY